MAIGSTTNMHYKHTQYFVAKICKEESKTNQRKVLTHITPLTDYQAAVSPNTSLTIRHCIVVLRLQYNLKRHLMEIIESRILRSLTMKILICWVLILITSCEE